MTQSREATTTPAVRETLGFVLGPLAFLVLLLLPPPSGLSVAAWRAAGVGLLMAIWWITEAIPIYATALLPIVLFPLTGVATIGATTAPYANPVIYLFMGGFIIAAGLERSGLHRRMAITIIRIAGTRPANLVGGFMVATAFISLWVSNTATVVMTLPMATSVIHAVEQEAGDDARGREAFPTCLLLGVAYAASIGGVGTLIGTPPTALLKGFMAETYDYDIGFVEWMAVGIPLVIVGIPVAWLLLTRVLHPVGRTELAGGREVFERQAANLGPLTWAEKAVAIVAALAAVAWITQPLLARVLPSLTDTGIAMTAGLLLFLIPVDWKRREFVLSWRDAEKMPWSVLVLFGGGLTIAAAIQSTGLDQAIGGALSGLGDWPLPLVTLLLSVLVIMLGELASNTAMAATFLPVAASVSIGMGEHPLLLAIPTALAAGFNFMLPAGTPPNAIIFGTGRISIPTMARAGFLLNMIFAGLLNLVLFTVAIRLFGLDGG